MFKYKTNIEIEVQSLNHLHRFQGNWFQANIYCMSRNMRLASIKSTKEQNELTKQFEVNTSK